MKVVDFNRILAFASRFPEMRMIGRARIDASRAGIHEQRQGHAISRFGNIRPGWTFAEGWRVERLAARPGEVDLFCVSPDGIDVRFLVGPATPGGPTCPFDTGPYRIGYQHDGPPFESIRTVGMSLAQRLVEDLPAEMSPEIWESMIQAASLPDAETKPEAYGNMVELRPDGKVYVRLTRDCQERCLFCFFFDTPQERGLADNAGLDAAVAAILDAVDPAETNQLILTGGEPTLVPGFERYLESFIERGFSDIVIQTNGILTARKGFLDRFAKYNDRISFGFSLHASTWQTNNVVTGLSSTTAFADKTASIRKAVQLGYVTKITCVMMKSNLAELTAIVDFCASLYESDARLSDNVILQFSMPVIRGLMAAHPEEYPALSEVRTDLEPALRKADALGLRASLSSLCSVPPCCLPDDLHHLETMWFRQGPAEWWETERAFGSRCAGCLLKTWCSGVSPAYLQWYGERELEPFKPESTTIVLP